MKQREQSQSLTVEEEAARLGNSRVKQQRGERRSPFVIPSGEILLSRTDIGRIKIWLALPTEGYRYQYQLGRRRLTPSDASSARTRNVCLDEKQQLHNLWSTSDNLFISLIELVSSAERAEPTRSQPTFYRLPPPIAPWHAGRSDDPVFFTFGRK